MKNSSFYLKRASLACEGRADLARTQRILTQVTMLSEERFGARTASVVDWEELTNFIKTSALVSPDLKIEISLNTFATVINDLHEKVMGVVGPIRSVISDFANKQGLMSKKDLFVSKVKKPDPTNYIESAISKALHSAGDVSSTLKTLGAIIAAKTPKQLSQAVGVPLKEFERNVQSATRPYLSGKNEVVQDIWEGAPKDRERAQSLMDFFAYMEDGKIFGFKLAIGILKGSVLALLMGTALSAIPGAIMALLCGIAVMTFLTDMKTTASFLRKFTVLGWSLPFTLINDLARSFKGLKSVKDWIMSWWKGEGSEDSGEAPEVKKNWITSLFKKAAMYEVQSLARNDYGYRQTLQLALNY